MAESSPTTPVKKTPTKTKKTMASKTKGDSAKKSATKRPSYPDMVTNAIVELSKTSKKGGSYSALVNYVKKRYELTEANNKKTLTSIRGALETLMKSGDIVAKEDIGFSGKQRYKLGDAMKKKIRKAEKTQNAEEDDDDDEDSPKVVKKAAAKKTPTKKQTKKTTTTPKKPAAKKTPKKAASKAQTPKKAAKAKA